VSEVAPDPASAAVLRVALQAEALVGLAVAVVVEPVAELGSARRAPARGAVRDGRIRSHEAIGVDAAGAGDADEQGQQAEGRQECSSHWSLWYGAARASLKNGRFRLDPRPGRTVSSSAEEVHHGGE
jgi:hypothetical protein